MPRALYVLPRAQRRGAAMTSTRLAAELAGEWEPLVVTLFAGGDPGGLGTSVPLRALGIEPGLGRRTLGVSPAAVRALRAAVAGYRPALVVAWGGEPLLHAAPVARRSGVRLLYVKISPTQAKLTRGLRRAVFRRALDRADGLVAITEELAEELRRDLGVRRPVAVAHNFRLPSDRPGPGDRAAFRAELGIGDDVVLAAFAGSLTHDKGPDLALEALALAPRHVHLAVAGAGRLEPAVRARAAETDLAGRVHLLGSRGDVPRILAGSDVVLLTSREEGRPGVLLEAALAGRPAAAFAVGGVSDLVTDGVEGVLVPAGDVAALGRALADLAADPAQREAMGAAAARRGDGYLAPAALPAWREAFRAATGGRRS